MVPENPEDFGRAAKHMTGDLSWENMSMDYWNMDEEDEEVFYSEESDQNLLNLNPNPNPILRSLTGAIIAALIVTLRAPFQPFQPFRPEES